MKQLRKIGGGCSFTKAKKYIESGSVLDMLAGNAPYIVNRATGELLPTGPAYPIEHYIEEYEKTLY